MTKLRPSDAGEASKSAEINTPDALKLSPTAESCRPPSEGLEAGEHPADQLTAIPTSGAAPQLPLTLTGLGESTEEDERLLWAPDKAFENRLDWLTSYPALLAKWLNELRFQLLKAGFSREFAVGVCRYLRASFEPSNRTGVKPPNVSGRDHDLFNRYEEVLNRACWRLEDQLRRRGMWDGFAARCADVLFSRAHDVGRGDAP